MRDPKIKDFARAVSHAARHVTEYRPLLDAGAGSPGRPGSKIVLRWSSGRSTNRNIEAANLWGGAFIDSRVVAREKDVVCEVFHQVTIINIDRTFSLRMAGTRGKAFVKCS